MSKQSNARAHSLLLHAQCSLKLIILHVLWGDCVPARPPRREEGVQGGRRCGFHLNRGMYRDGCWCGPESMGVENWKLSRLWCLVFVCALKEPFYQHPNDPFVFSLMWGKTTHQIFSSRTLHRKSALFLLFLPNCTSFYGLDVFSLLIHSHVKIWEFY